MATTFTEFKEKVIALYEAKKRNNELDDLLLNPSPANLRDYCLVRLSEGLPETDIEILQKFFDPFKREKSLEEAISKFNSGGLKASQKFILGKTENPEDRVIKLLAILVDYQPRPFRYNYEDKSHIGDEQDSESGSSIGNDREVVPTVTAPPEFHSETINEQKKGEVTETVNEPHISEPTFWQETGNMQRTEKELKTLPYKLHINKYAALFIGVTFTMIIVFFTVRALTPEECMCWNGERYIQVDCKSKRPPHQVIGLNKEKLDYFQKITKEDTLGLKDVGRVWYSKIYNDVEFFTHPGFHPVKHDRSLKLATEYIIKKYAGKSEGRID